MSTVEASGQEDVAMEGGVEEAKTAAAPTQPEEPEVEEEFTLKAGTKRKAPMQDASDGSDNDSDSDDSSVDIVLENPDSPARSKKGKSKFANDSERKAKVEERRATKIARYTEEYERAQAEVERLTEELALERAYPVQLEEAQGIAKEKKERLDRYVQAVSNRKSKAERKAEKKALKEAKKQEKKAKKAEKQAKKAKKGAEAAAEAGEEEEAFDYTKATSVLHANRNGGGSKGASKPAFDPYAKTGDDGPKGARKAPPTRGERSATFKK